MWVYVNGGLSAGTGSSRSVARPVEGLDVTGRDKSLSFTIPLNLDAGNNLIEVFAGNGIAEGSAAVSCSSKAKQPPPDLWILAIGVNKYDSDQLKDLNFAVNDAKDLADIFKAQEGKRYGRVNVRLLSDDTERPTAKNIRDSFGYFRQAGTGDLCVLFIAGHAVNDDKGNYFFMPADGAFDGAGIPVSGTAISHREINGVLDMPGQKLFFLDTCHSAGAGRSRIADTNSFIRQAMEYYPVIFSSSRDNEFSLEDPEYGHGLFTWGIIQGMKGEAEARRSGTVTMKALDSYVSDTVSELSRGRQNPTTSTPNGYVNFVLAELGE